MDPVQESQQQTAESYYNNTRKRSFLYSRVTVIVSTLVLVVALGVNISVLYSQQAKTIQSKASTPPSTQNLPALPEGCSYQRLTDGFKVVCATTAPTKTASVPVNITLPYLPPQCQLETTTEGSMIHCTAAVPIPTVSVTLPESCHATTQTNMISCTDSAQQSITEPLPSLPGGCSYAQVGQKYFVVCKSQ